MFEKPRHRTMLTAALADGLRALELLLLGGDRRA